MTQKGNNYIFEYSNSEAKRNKQKSLFRKHCFSYNDVGRSSAINRTASNYNDAKEKVKQNGELISTGKYDQDIA